MKEMLHVQATAIVPYQRMIAEEVRRDKEDPARTCTSSLSAPPATQVADPSLEISGRDLSINISIAISGDVLSCSSGGHKLLAPRED